MDWLTVFPLGLNQVTGFNWALLAIYFTLMGILSFWGLHRYQLIYLYRKYRKQAIQGPKKKFSKLPMVTVQLPVFNEPYIIKNLLEAIRQLDYPRELLQVQILDDSNDETSALAINSVKKLSAKGFPIEYHRRHHRQGYKAGALKTGLTLARGELIAIFDADFSPYPDFLNRTVHYFKDPSIGMVQGRWTFRNRNQSLLTQVQAILLDGHFVLEHGARSRSGRFFNFNGTAGVLRRSMIEDAGNWQYDTLTEDTDLSYRAQIKGWRFLYLADVEVPSELPLDMSSFQKQQARWAKGLIQTAKKILPLLIRSDSPRRVKLEACFHLVSNLSFPLMMLLALLLPLTTLIRYQYENGYLLYWDILLFLGTFSSICSFYLFAQRELYPKTWKKNLLLLPWIPAIGIGLTLTNSRAVMEALFNIPSIFERTAKLAGRSTDCSRLTGQTKIWLPVANLAMGVYFTLCLVYSLLAGNLISLPFLLLFATGYLFTGGLLLKQTTGTHLNGDKNCTN